MKVWLPALRVGTGTDVYTERLADALRGLGVSAHIDWFPPAYEFLPELLSRRKPPAGTDIVHGSTFTALPFLRRGWPVVATVHHLVHDPAFAPHRNRRQAVYHRLALRGRERRAIAGADAVVAVSPYVGGTVRAFAGRDDVDVIGNWVDTAHFSPPPPLATPRDGRPFCLLWVGNASRRKGADLLPSLARRLAGVAEIRCTGGLRGDTLPADRPPNLSLLGRLSDEALLHEYRQCDALLSLSRYEGFGYTALEAMACGRPVVGFRAGGFADVVQHGVTGLLSQVDDLDALAADVRSLDGDRLRSAAMGEAGRAYAVAQDGNASRYVALYERLLRR